MHSIVTSADSSSAWAKAGAVSTVAARTTSEATAIRRILVNHVSCSITGSVLEATGVFTQQRIHGVEASVLVLETENNDGLAPRNTGSYAG